jgi:hypothetical protein
MKTTLIMAKAKPSPGGGKPMVLGMYGISNITFQTEFHPLVILYILRIPNVPFLGPVMRDRDPVGILIPDICFAA